MIFLRNVARRVTFSLFARHFVAGEYMEDALKVAQHLNRENKKAIINILGEHEREPKRISWFLNEYLELLRQLSIRRLHAGIAIKLTQLGMDVNDNLCFKNAKQIVEKAERFGIDVEFDMESSCYTERITNLFLKILKRHGNIRIALQARLKRTRPDLERLLDSGAKIRLCKGAYKESGELSYQDASAISGIFTILASRLLASQDFQAIATHDPGLIDVCIETLSRQNQDFEFQMLFGLRKDLQDGLVKEGYNVTIYVPYGKDFMAYGLRRLPTLLKILFNKLMTRRGHKSHPIKGAFGNSRAS